MNISKRWQLQPLRYFRIKNPRMSTGQGNCRGLATKNGSLQQLRRVAKSRGNQWDCLFTPLDRQKTGSSQSHFILHQNVKGVVEIAVSTSNMGCRVVIQSNQLIYFCIPGCFFLQQSFNFLLDVCNFGIFDVLRINFFKVIGATSNLFCIRGKGKKNSGSNNNCLIPRLSFQATLFISGNIESNYSGKHRPETTDHFPTGLPITVVWKIGKQDSKEKSTDHHDRRPGFVTKYAHMTSRYFGDRSMSFAPYSATGEA